VVSGHVRVNRHCFIGVNATLRNDVTIGEYTLIGAGAVIMKDTAPRSVYVGSRTRPFDKTSDEMDL
jgi:acetyltransferase-like isoleucine patch superfamily enzyme